MYSRGGIFINNEFNYSAINMNSPVTNGNFQKSTNKGLKIVLIFGAIFLCVLLVVVGFLFFRNTIKYNRTIMIYMVGSDLESENKIATYDLKDIDAEDVDLENTNVILMVGGAKEWHNYVSSDEVAIYELTSSGFEKSVSYDLSSMGDSKNLVKFLKYAYYKYRSEKYDLIFWNHGIGAYGIESDEIYEDYLTITELSDSMEDSPFNEENKLSSVLFINCLSANLHFAQVMSGYADYMIASEELSYGNASLDKLNFIENLEKDDDGYEYGVKFIENYSISVDKYNNKSYKNIDSTYSIIDLSKTSKVIDGLNEVVSYIDVLESYKTLAKLRGNIVTYGKEVKSFDTVDLYALVYGLKNIAPSDVVNNLLLDIKDFVVYNWALNSYSYGVSVYFPYHGNNKYVNLHFNELEEIDNNEYLSFIQAFHNIKSSNYTDFNVSRNFGSATSEVFNFVLDESQIDDFSRASVVVLKDMNNGYFSPVYTSSDTILNDNGVISFDFKGKALKVVDKNDGSSSVLYLSVQSIGDNYIEYLTFAMLQDEFGKSVPVEIYIVVDEENPNGYISRVVKSDEELPAMAILELEDFSEIFFTNFEYKVFDSLGNYVNDWQASGVSYLFKVDSSSDKYEFEILDLSNDIDDYYCVFKVYDINNEVHYSDLIAIK